MWHLSFKLTDDFALGSEIWRVTAAVTLAGVESIEPRLSGSLSSLPYGIAYACVLNTHKRQQPNMGRCSWGDALSKFPKSCGCCKLLNHHILVSTEMLVDDQPIYG